MKIEDYDKKIVLAFGFGAGGLYVREHYEEAVQGKDGLKDIVDSIIHDINLDIGSGDSDPSYKDLIKRSVSNDEDCIQFINNYLGDNKMCYPELCGTVAGTLFREGRLKETLDFLEVSDMEEERYWDS